jgi:hypothetical protein
MEGQDTRDRWPKKMRWATFWANSSGHPAPDSLRQGGAALLRWQWADRHDRRQGTDLIDLISAENFSQKNFTLKFLQFLMPELHMYVFKFIL